MDGFEVKLADGTVVCVLPIVDDCSRLDIALRAVRSENSTDVWEFFQADTPLCPRHHTLIHSPNYQNRIGPNNKIPLTRNRQ
jgi:hypothetical protein